MDTKFYLFGLGRQSGLVNLEIRIPKSCWVGASIFDIDDVASDPGHRIFDWKAVNIDMDIDKRVSINVLTLIVKLIREVSDNWEDIDIDKPSLR